MLSTVLLALSILFAGAPGASATSAAATGGCQATCEQNYKYCVDKRVSSEKTCRAEYEKCRRHCEKKDGKATPG